VNSDPSQSAREIARQVRNGQTTAAAITETALSIAQQQNAKLNAFTTLLPARARAEAARVDAAIAAGENPGPLAGVPFAVKNLFDVKGLSTLAGSKIRRDALPARENATVIKRLTEAGAILLGALNMDEFAYGFVTENAHYGATHNPYDVTRIAGGSSGGSAAAVAGGLVPLALGSDTNGSIRVPASLCGIFGLKPTYGRLSRAGSFPFVHSFDHVGAFARSVADLALCYDLLQGDDPRDPAQTPRPIEPSLPDLEAGRGDLRAAVLGGWFQQGATDQALAAVARVAVALGANVTVELKASEVARAAAFCVTAAEGANLHLPDLRVRAGDYDAATRSRFLAGALLPGQYLLQAQRFRAWYRAQALELLQQYDVLLAPATPCAAPLIGQVTMKLADREIPVRANLGLYTQPISFIGLPVVTVPVWSDGAELPIGVQIIAAPWREALALQVAHGLERAGAVGYRPLERFPPEWNDSSVRKPL